MNPKTKDRINKFLRRIPLHVVVIAIVFVWIIPTVGLLVTSFRPVQRVNETGWWTAFSKDTRDITYETYCGECHGSTGNAILAADLSDPEFLGQFRRSIQIIQTFDNEYDGEIHVPNESRPDQNDLANILEYLRDTASGEPIPRFTLRNYIDVLAGYRGNLDYITDCELGNTLPGQRTCDFVQDIFLAQASMTRALINTILVTIPATLIPITIGAFAAFAFSWLDFYGRQVLFAILVGLIIVPLQVALIPLFRLYVDVGLTGTFLGVWLFHTAFALPYAIYLIRNFLGSLPQEIFESAYMDGASPWTAFTRLAIPLSMPALASLAIFQFLWVWNDLLVALIFLGGSTPVMTYQISNMVTSLGAGWHLLTAAAFISFLIPMLIFFFMQRYFVRGMLAGSVKG
jgi:alpha-glucoside transport system permease protein